MCVFYAAQAQALAAGSKACRTVAAERTRSTWPCCVWPARARSAEPAGWGGGIPALLRVTHGWPCKAPAHGLVRDGPVSIRENPTLKEKCSFKEALGSNGGGAV